MVSTEVIWIVALIVVFSVASGSNSRLPSNSVNAPRTLLTIMCLTLKPTELWLAAMV